MDPTKVINLKYTCFSSVTILVLVWHLNPVFLYTDNWFRFQSKAMHNIFLWQTFGENNDKKKTKNLKEASYHCLYTYLYIMESKFIYLYIYHGVKVWIYGHTKWEKIWQDRLALTSIFCLCFTLVKSNQTVTFMIFSSLVPIQVIAVMMIIMIRGTFKSKAQLRVQFSPALGGRGWERVKAEASPRLY